MRAVLVFCAIAACSKGGAAPAPGTGSGSAHVTPDASVASMDGPQLFATFCAQCHGADAKGYKSDHAPSLVTATFLATADDKYLAHSIEQGRPGTAMAAYGKAVGGPLDDQAIQKIVAWVRQQGGNPKAIDVPAPPSGDATRGAAIYAASCQKCHGTESQRGDYLMLANQKFLAMATDPFIYYAIVNGRPATPMPAFDKTLSLQAIADTVAYIRSLQKGATTSQIVPLPAPTGKEPLFVNPNGAAPVWKTIREGKYVPADDVKAALDAHKKLVIIDARPESEWMTVHITGAVSIPHYKLDRLKDIPKDATVVAYCACPHHLSGIVVDELIARGYKHAYVLDEGILEWQRRDYPIVAAQGVTKPPAEPAGPAMR